MVLRDVTGVKTCHFYHKSDSHFTIFECQHCRNCCLRCCTGDQLVQITLGGHANAYLTQKLTIQQQKHCPVKYPPNIYREQKM